MAAGSVPLVAVLRDARESALLRTRLIDVLRRRRVGMAACHKEIHGQLGAELLRARDVEGPLAHRGELVAHAAVVVVIGDLLAGDAARDATAAQVGELVNAIPGDEPLAYRLHQLGLVVRLPLRLP